MDKFEGLHSILDDDFEVSLTMTVFRLHYQYLHKLYQV